MVKIRLRRIGTKGRPYYRVVVAKSTAGRNGKFVENIGSYDPVVKPTKIEVNEERALHWLRSGAQPTETTAYLLNKVGVLERYLQERPNARKQFSYLDKRTAASSVASVVDEPVVSKKKASTAPEPSVEAPAEPAVGAQPEAAQPTAETPNVEAQAESAEASGESAESQGDAHVVEGADTDTQSDLAEAQSAPAAEESTESAE